MLQQDVTLAILGHFAPTPLNAEALKDHIETALVPSGVTATTARYFSARIMEFYELSWPSVVPAEIHAWAALLADIIFRLPPYLVAIAARDEWPPTAGKVYLYEFQAKSPYPNWRPGYDRSHHAVTDIFLFDVAADLVPEQHRNRWDMAVSELQSAWIQFCWGKLPWTAASMDSAETVYGLQDDKTWQSWQDLSDLVGDRTIQRWEEMRGIADWE
jgi:hypothetical protein